MVDMNCVSGQAPRRATALFSALTGMQDFIREPLEYRAIRLADTPIFAHTYAAFSCGMSCYVSKLELCGVLATKWWPTRSSCTGGVGAAVVAAVTLSNTENQPLAQRKCRAVHQAILGLASRA